MSSDPSETSSSVDLFWLPLGAGGTRAAQWSGHAFEAAVAARTRRRRLHLYHSALEVTLDDDRYVIEMTLAFGRAHDAAAVVVGGPVGTRALGRLRVFRYEIHRSKDGVIPDLRHAVDSPRRLSTDRLQAERVLRLVPAFPTATWGRDELGTGDMWNSNSLTAWLLARSGHVTDGIVPPAGGRAPGWSAGMVVAGRQLLTSR
jgi:hypothetical protein